MPRFMVGSLLQLLVALQMQAQLLPAVPNLLSLDGCWKCLLLWLLPPNMDTKTKQRSDLQEH